jgi:HAE1 family hydrophobic/amphiphilic exporter-1
MRRASAGIVILLVAAAPLRADPPQALELSEAIQLAVRDNLGIELERAQSAVTRASIGVAWGRFEPSLNAAYGYANADTPPPVALLQQGVVSSQLKIESHLWSVGLATELPTGTQLSVSWNNLRTLSTSTMPLTDPLLYNSGLTFSLVQPLLKGFAFDLAVPMANVLRAKLASRRAALDVRAALIATLKATEDAYWDLRGAIQEREVRHTFLELARQQVSFTDKQIRAGIVPAAELIAAESTLAQRELAVIEADAAIPRASDRLRQVLGLPRADWSRPLIPVDPPHSQEPQVTLDAAMALALKNRPDLEQRRIDLERTKLDVRTARAERLPALDVGFSYGLIGQEPSYHGTLDQMISNKVRSWSTWASFSWSPLMVRARALVAANLAGQRAAQVQLEAQAIDLDVELRDALLEIDTAARQIGAATRYRELATRALDVEERRFQDGSSNNFMIGQRQAELAQAQLAELRAVIRRCKAGTALEAAMGTLIEARGVKLDVGGSAP